MPASAHWRFRPGLSPTVAAALLVTFFLAAGHWQWDKATHKRALQAQIDAGRTAAPLAMPTSLVGDTQALRYRRLTARGEYEPAHQILLDNRVLHEQAGYDVITPLRLAGSPMHVLVNRGWVAALGDRRQLPRVETPTGSVEVTGMAVVPGTRFFTLGTEAQNTPMQWQSVWQNLDMARFGRAVPFPIQPIVIQLDADNRMAGGFTREWPRPDERLQTHLNYAVQWWTFAATTLVLWLVLNFRRTS